MLQYHYSRLFTWATLPLMEISSNRQERTKKRSWKCYRTFAVPPEHNSSNIPNEFFLHRYVQNVSSPKNLQLQVLCNNLAVIVNVPMHSDWKFNWIEPKSSHITIQSVLIQIRPIIPLYFRHIFLKTPQNLFFFRMKL